MAKGISSQFIRGANDVSTLEARALAADHVRQVLMTRAGDERTAGEIPWLQTFGSRIDRLRHRAIDDRTLTLAKTLALSAVQTWVPEVSVIGVTAEKDLTVDRGVRISLTYEVNDSGITDSVATTVSAG